MPSPDTPTPPRPAPKPAPRPAPKPAPRPPQFPPNREIRDGDRPRERR